MGFQFDVKAKTLAATAATGIGQPRARIKSIYFVAGTAGYISFTDGGAGGTERIRLATPASTAGNGSTYVLIPGDGVVFQDDPYLTISGPTSVTFFYG
jgi:hypothetical protein